MYLRTIIDAKHIQSHIDLKSGSEAVNQVAYADRILLNKTDLVTPEDLEVVVGLAVVQACWQLALRWPREWWRWWRCGLWVRVWVWPQAAVSSVQPVQAARCIEIYRSAVALA